MFLGLLRRTAPVVLVVLLVVAPASLRVLGASQYDVDQAADNTISQFGRGTTHVYGQAFTSPAAVGLTLESFAFSMVTGSTQFRAAVARWDDATQALVGPILFKSSSPIVNPGGGSVSTPTSTTVNVPLQPSTRYAVFWTVADDPNGPDYGGYASFHWGGAGALDSGFIFKNTQGGPAVEDALLYTAWDNFITGYLAMQLVFTNTGEHGDPQFSGFLGQSYQVHGISGNDYNVLSTPSLQYNALFSYLESGRCRAGTPCYSHPGNYFGAVAMMMASDDSTVDGALVRATAGGGSTAEGFTAMPRSVRTLRIESGAVDVGLNATLDGAALTVGVPVSVPLAGWGAVAAGVATVELVSAFEVQLRSPQFDLRVQNSDYFLNQDVGVAGELMTAIQHYKQAAKSAVATANSVELAAEAAQLPHGLLGQTWQSRTYANRWRHIEGTLTDYELEDGLEGSVFKYNRFQRA